MSHAPLHPDTRNLLAREILKAREAAEEGAKASLAALRVGEASPADGMTAGERSLRNRLRANGRQLGDVKFVDDRQELGYLVEEIAYQHWHRMLFARFLAENGLLREDQGDQPIDLAECEALANAEGLDMWAYAARCAQKMLPGVFRVDDPKLELRLDTPKQLELNAILKNLPSQVFTATDALGWVYQYWQEKRKEGVEQLVKMGQKVGPKELSPATQLFTEDYMVDFLLHNALGAWWAGKMGRIEAATEDEARAKAGLPAKGGLPAVVWTYLRFIQDAETKKWTPAGGTFEGWPRKAKDITFLDPCMGSGHFPVFALPILARMRLEEEGGTPAENIHAVLKDQIHGLELDQRCCQIGAFNLALTAWKLAGFQQLPPLNVACCGIAPRAKLEDWVKLAGNDEKLKAGMARLHKLFEQAPVLGSLINPRAGEGDLLTASYKELRPLLERAFATEIDDVMASEMVVAAKGASKAAEILSDSFVLVATNVPYLGAAKQCEDLKVYAERAFSSAKSDLATIMLSRISQMVVAGGSVISVVPQNWIFLKSYRDFRVQMLSDFAWSILAKLGPKSFQTPMYDFNTMLFCFTSAKHTDPHSFRGLDVMAPDTCSGKASELLSASVVCINQESQVRNPGAIVAFEEVNSESLVSTYADSVHGLSPGDRARFVRYFFEFSSKAQSWEFMCSSPDGISPLSGKHYLVFNPEYISKNFDVPGFRLDGTRAWGRMGVFVSAMGRLPSSIYLGEIFDANGHVLLPRTESDICALYLFCKSKEFHDAVRVVDQKVAVTTGSLLLASVEMQCWRSAAEGISVSTLIGEAPTSPDLWLYSPDAKSEVFALQVAVSRMLGYQWPRQTGSSFPDCPALGPDGLEKHHDDDGVVPLAAINREEAAATRLRALLKDAYGSEWNPATTEKELLAAAGHGAATLEEWLQGSFFEEHCKLFHHRPFVWHIWDGQEDGFHVLVNYHRLAAGNGDGTRLLQKIATTYLGDWIARCNQEVAADKPGAARRLDAAQKLQADLRKILEGEAPHDIFVRWKPLHEQAIGWEPDINDGVRLNIRPFLTVRDVKKRGAGLLRFKPNIKWDKDRGKEPERLKADFPWFWSCDPETNPGQGTDFAGGSTFTGERWNDLHYTLASKRAARAKKA
jgi:hypothetical protein